MLEMQIMQINDVDTMMRKCSHDPATLWHFDCVENQTIFDTLIV